MNLSRILDGVPVIKMFQTLYGKMVVTHDVEIHGIQYDSRLIERDQMFVAIKGVQTDGHRFIDRAIENGAKVAVLEDDSSYPDSYFMHAGVVKIVVESSRKALALMSANFFDRPSHKLRLIGVTGTNGKTSTSYLIKSILEAQGEMVGLIGTIDYKIGNESIPATHTTPESLELNQLLSMMVNKGCTAAVMEVSSHSLALDRVCGLKFSCAAFTNLTQDHLDFHGTMDRYFGAKKMLFDNLSVDASAVTNSDDPHGASIVSGTRAKTVSYGIGSGDVNATNVRVSVRETSFTVQYKESSHVVSSGLIGKFNVYNLLAAYAVGIQSGIEEKNILQGIRSTQSVPGRFQQFLSPKGWTAVVDYAHTPDALEKCLHATHEIMPVNTGGRIITVFGAGGDRDKGKRPLMGKVVSAQSDIAILTSDNPRFEDPGQIIADIQKGISGKAKIYMEPDRRIAIAMGLKMAKAGDVVLLAGKGHEEYQVIGDEKTHLNDREEVEKFLRGSQ